MMYASELTLSFVSIFITDVDLTSIYIAYCRLYDCYLFEDMYDKLIRTLSVQKLQVATHMMYMLKIR